MTQPNSNGKTVTAQTRQRLADDRTISTEETAGGVLVFADAELPGRKLIGFTRVESWSLIRNELIRQGLGVGAIHNLPEFDASEVPA